MHSEWYIVMDVGVRDIDRDDEYRRPAFRDGCLAGHDGLAPGLFGGQDHVAIDATAPVYRLGVDLLRKIEPQFVANDLASDQNDGRAIAVRLDDAIDEILKLGFEVAQSSVAKYMVKRRRPPSQGWRTFLDRKSVV